MNYSINNNTLTISLPTHIDTAVSVQVDEQIRKICAENPHQTLVLDASELEFISSSGLRVLLGTAKRESDMKITEVSTEVYNVFSMTGFTRIFHVEQRLREICIDGCPVLGKGGVGTVYRLTEDTILKVFREGTPLSDVLREINLSKEALVYGLPTAISFEPVRVGNQYGIIHELINARTLASIIDSDPSQAEHYGAMFGQLMKQVHRIHDDNHTLPNAVEETQLKFEKLRRYFTDEQVAILREIYDAIPAGNSILHCDLHPKNVMMSNGELILIDMGEVCHGNPLQDLSHTYSSMMGLVGNYREIVGMDEEVAHRCYLSAIRAYFDTADEAMIARRLEQIRVASLIRNISWLSLSDSFPQELIDACKRLFEERIASQMEHIRTILPQFSEW